jgi:hypothetical protein
VGIALAVFATFLGLATLLAMLMVDDAACSSHGGTLVRSGWGGVECVVEATSP